MSKSIVRIVMLCLAYSCLAGCGTKGPLYIPEQRYPQGAENNSAPKVVNQYATGLKHSSAGVQTNIHAPSRASI